ncbi:GAF domain-containing protein [bacterium]|nr:GAF domain-containing protein [bacterium]
MPHNEANPEPLAVERRSTRTGQHAVRILMNEPAGPVPLTVRISAPDKPVVPSDTLRKWQKLIDLVTVAIDVPAGLVTRLEPDCLRPLLCSRSAENPFTIDDRFPLESGNCCETVLGLRDELYIPEIREDSVWNGCGLNGMRIVSYLGLPIMWNDGELFGTICALDRKPHRHPQIDRSLLSLCRDVIESDLKDLLRCAELKRLEEKADLHCTESNHRIMNQLNMLVSLINLTAARKKDNGELQEVLADLSSSIRAVALIHERMQDSESCGVMYLNRYLRSLVTTILQAFSRSTISYTCDVDEIPMSAGSLVYCGQIISEMITNSLKYGFDGNMKDPPHITIAAHNVGTDKVTVFYKDNGKGFPEGFDPHTSGSRGMKLIHLLCSQLDGELHINSDEGVGYLITFPLA